jgi:hypothetical protein
MIESKRISVEHSRRGEKQASFEEREFAPALLAIGGNVDSATAARTQRRVRERLTCMAERRRRTRQRIGLAILAFSLLLLVMTPVIWNAVHLQMDEGWQDFAGVDMQTVYVLGWFIPVTIAGLILACLGLKASRRTRRVDHHAGVRLSSFVR